MSPSAFLAGMVVGRSEYSLRAASEALPMRDAFAVLFVVSVGMLLDPLYVVDAPGLIAATLGVVLLGKPLAALLVVLLLRYPMKVGLAVAVALAQIGEFSFILASLGLELGILPAAAMQTIVAVAIISIMLNPLPYRMLRRSNGVLRTGDGLEPQVSPLSVRQSNRREHAERITARLSSVMVRPDAR